MLTNHTGRRLRRTGLAAAAVLSVSGGMLAAGFASPASASVAGVVINEVESNGDTTDWVELFNPTGSPISLSGAVLSDADDTHAFPLSGTVAAGGYAVFDVSVGTDGFGLGAPEDIRLIDGNDPATDPTIDSYSWASHAPTTYGRNWAVDDDSDGLGDFQVTDHATRGTVNVFPGGSIGDIDGVVLNEVESNGDTTDWIELYNTTGAPIDISGALLSDNDNGHVFTVPASTTLAANGYAAFSVDSAFGLGASDSARLFAPGDVALGTVIDSYTWTTHAVVTYGRDWTVDADLDGLGDWKPTTASTFGVVNQFASGSPVSLAGVKINEVKSTGDDVHGDWVELRNTNGSGSVNLAGAILSDASDNHVVRIPSGTTLAAGQVIALRVDDPALPGNFGLGDADAARLFRSDTSNLTTPAPGQLADSRSWTTHARTSWGFDSGSAVETNVPTYGAANDYSTPTVPDASWVVLNEIESSVSGGQDFVELKNTASTAIDVTGMVLSDSDNTHAYVIPSTSPIAAGGLLTIEIDTVTGGFGLGSDDAVRLYRSGATVGTSIPLDHHEWTVHATGTYSRTAGGLGDWADCTSTKNAANAC
ncbi:lamin tail domain-containing protein [Nocardioides carbamazepini]|uniref:lamin tail domain-containing protein n=1 Tax=Nocardioides carbamazepini TaxID=2854259 RepID=UPI002149D932|nr:lamin tail domain-containing protein [Nocardioides carbamazepini]MCR1783952.1 lamin tail domain-containing protein [Nocardioides carbamazepini]